MCKTWGVAGGWGPLWGRSSRELSNLSFQKQNKQGKGNINEKYIYHLYHLLRAHWFLLGNTLVLCCCFFNFVSAVRLKPKPTPSPPLNISSSLHQFFFNMATFMWGKKGEWKFSHTESQYQRLCILHASGKLGSKKLIQLFNIIYLVRVRWNVNQACLYYFHYIMLSISCGVVSCLNGALQESTKNLLPSQNAVFVDLK